MRNSVSVIECSIGERHIMPNTNTGIYSLEGFISLTCSVILKNLSM